MFFLNCSYRKKRTSRQRTCVFCQSKCVQAQNPPQNPLGEGCPDQWRKYIGWDKGKGRVEATDKRIKSEQGAKKKGGVHVAIPQKFRHKFR